MTSPWHAEGEISRRRFLAMGGAAAVAGTVGGWMDPLSARGATRWPTAGLSVRDAVRVRQSQFMPVGQFLRWNHALDRLGPANQRGLRATGSADTEHYIDTLRDDLDRAGVKQLHFDEVPFRRWTTDTWSLDLLRGSQAVPVKTASYIPYTGPTPPQGVSGQLGVVPAGTTPAPGSLAGKIAVVDVPITVVPLSFFTSLAYPGAVYDPHHQENPSQTYKRPYLNGIVPLLDAVDVAGAVGVIGVLDFPSAAADGSYFPYDGIFRRVPGLYVDRNTGAALKQQAKAGARARLTLPAQVKDVTSRNLIGFIPGQSSELVTLHCHTDGSNAIEDNGPGAIVAISQYLARLPRRALPRTIMILLTTGHFNGGSGSREFRRQHANDLVKRTNAAITIEHLGTREWLEVTPGRMGFTHRPEPGAIFAPGSKALVDASLAAIKRAASNPADVLKPLDPTGNGVTVATWPGEGQYLFARGGIADANYITGPTYLLNWGITTIDQVNHYAIRAQAIAFTEMILRLGRTPRNQLITYTI